MRLLQTIPIDNDARSLADVSPVDLEQRLEESGLPTARSWGLDARSEARLS